MVLIATDLPEPVVPAIKRCGMRARSTMMESPPIFLPRHSGSFATDFVVVLDRQQFAQIDLFAMRVRQFDADGVAARNHRDARRKRAHRTGDVVGQPDHPRRFDAGCGFEFVQRHHRTRMSLDDFAADAEIAEHAFQRARVGIQLRLVERLAVGSLRRGQHGNRRQLEPVGDLRERRARCRLLARRAGDGASSSSSSSSSVEFFFRRAEPAMAPARPRLGSWRSNESGAAPARLRPARRRPGSTAATAAPSRSSPHETPIPARPNRRHRLPRTARRHPRSRSFLVLRARTHAARDQECRNRQQ